MQRGPASRVWKTALGVPIRAGQGAKSVREPRLDVIVVYDFLTECVRPSLGTLVHLDAHGVLLSTSFLQRCDGLLSHSFSDWGLLNFLMNRHLPENWVEFLQLNPLGSVLTVFSRHIT